MKIAVIIAAFLCLASAIHVCFPEEFTTRSMTYDSAHKDAWLSKVWYSKEMRSERYDFDVDEKKPERRHESLVFKFHEDKLYRITWENRKVESCHVSKLNQTQEILCLSKRAEHRGTFTLGGFLTVDNYIEREEKNHDRILFDIMAAKNINIPIRTHTRIERADKTKDQLTDEFWDFHEEVHHDAFVLPDECNKATESSFTPNLRARSALLAQSNLWNRFQ
eukprot:TRINITY_DN6_c1_g1_i1.p1 TRINITY_DN6_c1_g1~~TRINITY_DN6_c1_g1_i1.p1  ORF type:complete len:221 (-),score=55.08 TRINITY_DN6_c1_g1_i1:83-745(-)